jgi:hypothetical protein
MTLYPPDTRFTYHGYEWRIDHYDCKKDEYLCTCASVLNYRGTPYNQAYFREEHVAQMLNNNSEEYTIRPVL